MLYLANYNIIIEEINIIMKVLIITLISSFFPSFSYLHVETGGRGGADFADHIRMEWNPEECAQMTVMNYLHNCLGTSGRVQNFNFK